MIEIDKFQRYGITLSRLRESEIQMLRAWRNSSLNINEMRLQAGKIISADEQIKWFNSIKDKDDAFYFIAYQNSKPIGYNAIKNIDYVKKCGEPGGLYNPEIYDISPFTRYARIAVANDFYFEKLGLDFTYIFVKNSNKKAIRLNSLIGYKADLSKNDGNFLYFRLEKNEYFVRRDKMLKALKIT